MSFINCDIPRNLNEFIGSTTLLLREILTAGGAKGYKGPYSVNLLWNNSILGAEFHFSPWNNKIENYNIAGVKSDYFEKLLSYAPLPTPTSEDIVFLAEYGANSPHVISAFNKYIQTDRFTAQNCYNSLFNNMFGKIKNNQKVIPTSSGFRNFDFYTLIFNFSNWPSVSLRNIVSIYAMQLGETMLVSDHSLRFC